MAGGGGDAVSPAPNGPRGPGRPEARDRRAVPRTQVPERPAARVRGLREARLLDLSLAGARIEHLVPLRLGVACTVEIPPALRSAHPPCPGGLVRRGRSEAEVRGRDARRGPDGLRFSALTVAQRAALTDIRQALSEALRPIA